MKGETHQTVVASGVYHALTHDEQYPDHVVWLCLPSMFALNKLKAKPNATDKREAFSSWGLTAVDNQLLEHSASADKSRYYMQCVQRSKERLDFKKTQTAKTTHPGHFDAFCMNSA